MAEPFLQQRRGCRNGDERQPDRHRQQGDQPRDGRAVGRWRPAARRLDRKNHESGRQQCQMEHNLRLDPHQPGGGMDVQVAGQQRRLEEYHGGVPHRRRSTQKRQHHLREHRLQREQKQRAHQRRQDVKRQYGACLSHGQCPSRWYVAYMACPGNSAGMNGGSKRSLYPK